MKKIQKTILFLSCSHCFLSAVEQSPPTQEISFLADWIYLQPNETGLAYAIHNEDFNLLNDTLMGSGLAAEPKFHWHSGLRLGMDYKTPQDEWELLSLWTWYEGTGSDAQHSKTQAPTILPTFIHPNVYNSQPVAACLSASADLSIHLNVLDLTLGKKCQMSKSLSIKPLFGLRNLWLNQSYSVEYDTLFDKTEELILSHYNTEIKNNYWGLGILGGVNSEWSIKWGLSLFGNCALSLLYGFFNTNYEESYTTPTGASRSVISEANSFRAGKPVLDMQLGLKWTSPYYKNRFKIDLQSGWEHHFFFSQNQIMRFTDGQSWGTFVQNQGDLDFQGWSAAIRIYF